ncbi:MAG: sodium-independent anion transporter [Myxococcales bacterium]|nr:sodium-independent anion transporter [Myxococcales bacterium]
MGNPKNDALSGLTVALALVPEAVAFAFVAGIDPLVGLYGAFMMCLITSLFGGRPGMISGATGAMAVVMVHLIQKGNIVGGDLGIDNLGLSWLFISLLVVGVLQIFAGIFKLGKFVRLIPHPVMMGFVNGLAIVIFISQLGMFTRVTHGERSWMQGIELMTMITLVGATMLIMWLLPKLTKALPAALTAILLVTAVVVGADLEVNTVGSFIREGGGEGLKGGLPKLQWNLISVIPSIEGHWSQLISTAFLLAAVGLIESLMTLNLVDDLTETRGSGNRECIAQGGANLINGLFGGMGGCAMIGQSIINVNSGGRGRLSGVVAALGLLSSILFGAALIEQVPIAALVGVMFMVVIGTFAWSSFRIIQKIPTSDAIVLISVSAITVWQDLAIAVIAGVIMSALKFAWENAIRIRARKRLKEDGTKVYEIWGPLFFGSVQTFATKFDVKDDPSDVEIDFIESRVSDHSGIEAIKRIIERYLDVNKRVTLTHLSPECKSILIKANPRFDKYIESSVEDPRYHVVTDLMDTEV